ncbi:MAG: hypothetical protein IM535_11575 [Pseudanabaena sp. M38BS1SP1A06MG]|nr:hypothetical protein [Pseudanabaena sp. M34BS1SP1A06MG]MCA6592721.1 hypothetical protein [Pseudanabaena sp. M38BS1SP1A06MG]
MVSFFLKFCELTSHEERYRPSTSPKSDRPPSSPKQRSPSHIPEQGYLR